jgi:hypothetical protein
MLPWRQGLLALMSLLAVSGCECGDSFQRLSEKTRLTFLPYKKGQTLLAEDSAGVQDTLQIAEQISQRVQNLDCYSGEEDGEEYSYYRLPLNADSSATLVGEGWAAVQSDARDSIFLQLLLPGQRLRFWLYRTQAGAFRLDTGRTHRELRELYDCNCCLTNAAIALQNKEAATYFESSFSNVTELTLSLTLADSIPVAEERFAPQASDCTPGQSCSGGCFAGSYEFKLAFAESFGLVYWDQRRPGLSRQRLYRLQFE